MDQWTSKCRSMLYPMVGVILVGSLWALASEKAQSDRVDDPYSQPLPTLENRTATAAPTAVASSDGQ